MREKLWLLLRNSRLVRRLAAIPAFAKPMRAASFMLVPAFGQRRVQVRSGPGRGLLLDLNPRWEHPFWEGTYELRIQEFLCSQLKPGMVLFDVGANFGFYSLLAARAGARVFAFEPDASIARSLEHHARLNRLESSIRIIPAAVFSSSGMIALEPADSTRAHGNAHIRPADGESRTAIHAPSITLDDFVRDNPAPSLVKMDVEGAESEVLKGAEHVFQTAKPHLLCEVHDASNAEFVAAWLEARGYRLTWLAKGDSFPKHIFASPASEWNGSAP